MGSTSDRRTTAEIYKEAADVNDQVTYGLKNALQIVDNTRDVQASTLEDLKKQGDQLGEIQASLDDVQEDNKYAQAVLDDIGCLCWCFGRKKSNKLQRPVHTSAYKPKAESKPNKTTTKPNGIPAMTRSELNKQAAEQTTNTSSEDPVLKRIEDGKKEQDTLIDQISSGLDVLAHGAKAMGEELASQDKDIQALEIQTDDVVQETKATTHNAAFRRHLRNY